MISKRRAFIVGIKGYKLTNKEISFLRKYRPWGIILFTRNIKSIEQTRLLTEKIKSIFKDKKLSNYDRSRRRRCFKIGKYFDLKTI